MDFSAAGFNKLLLLEEERDAPDGADAHEYIDDTADNSRLTAEQEGDEIETEYPEQTPVHASDYQQQQSDPVKHFVHLPFLAEHIIDGFAEVIQGNFEFF